MAETLDGGRQKKFRDLHQVYRITVDEAVDGAVEKIEKSIEPEEELAIIGLSNRLAQINEEQAAAEGIDLTPY